tara:strand:+ start:18 stop:740 length:723 start_codon:yes stop_codon:yes gene_type:complete
MIKKNVLIFGKGKWGKILIRELRTISNILRIEDSKTNLKKINLNNIDWVFVITPNNTHYKLVNFFLQKNKNVFCEKPLTLSSKQTQKLITNATKKKCKLYISDVENYKNKKIKQTNKFYIKRKKRGCDNQKGILYRLTYHDFYLLKKFMTPLNQIKIKKEYLKNKLFMNIKKNNLEINFEYDLDCNKKIHKINNYDFRIFRGNPLRRMLNNVLSGKANFVENNKQGLFCNKMIEKILSAS